jgi:hypothetical protein
MKLIRMYICVVFLAACFSVYALSAQTNLNGRKTQLSFDDVCASLASHSCTKGDFTQTKTLAKLHRSFTSSGKFIISSQDGIVWQTLTPYQSTSSLTKSGIIQIAADGTKTVMDASSNRTFTDISEVISSVFTGKSDVIKKSFTVSFVAPENESKAAFSWKAVLVPVDATIASFMKQITLGGKSKDIFSLDEITIDETSGDVIAYLLLNQQYAEHLTDKEKTFFEKE